MVDRDKLKNAIARAILPYAQETPPPEESDDDFQVDQFVIETATFFSQEVIDAKIEISDDQAELDDEDLESLPITQILTPHLLDLLGPKNSVSIISNIIQIYTAPEPAPENHQHIRYGSCEVQPLLEPVDQFSYASDSCH